jgi:hypothetical protein
MQDYMHCTYRGRQYHRIEFHSHSGKLNHHVNTYRKNETMLFLFPNEVGDKKQNML